jgi:alkanesulfonate monooxygenase SsuD/methylene tetrahydromethanopterin reductase-like flavin-dependent oxidoreductase (luciferase family)
VRAFQNFATLDLLQNPLPIWLGVGRTPQSFVRAGQLGLPLMVAIIAMTDIGKERGWPAMTRASFDAQRGRDGALLIGSPDEVVDLPHVKMMPLGDLPTP